MSVPGHIRLFFNLLRHASKTVVASGPPSMHENMTHALSRQTNHPAHRRLGATGHPGGTGEATRGIRSGGIAADLCVFAMAG